MSLTQRVLEASQGRDRVIDAVKALALTLVILGHGLAWTTLPDGTVTNTLETAPNLYPLTWVLQVLPLFFLLAGAGLTRQADNPSGTGTLRRVERLTAPTLPLLGITLVLTTGISLSIGGSISQAAGLLPIQLTWFIGIYLIVIAAAPLLRRMTRPWHFVAALLVIGGVDAIRATVAPPVGWINLILVWSFFAAIGMHLPQLRALPKWIPGLGLALSLGAAITAINVGPYSKALITTTALPGLSNLAPPTIVLAFAGLAQICLLLLTWNWLAKLLSRNRVWVPIAIFSTRAMGLYLYHMLALSLLVAAQLALGFAPLPLSPTWWLAHVLVLASVAALVWFTSPLLLRAGNNVARTLGKVTPQRFSAAVARIPAWVAALWASGIGLCYMLMSESGISSPLTLRTVLYLPYMPIIVLLAIAATAAAARSAQHAAQSTAPPDSSATPEPGEPRE